MQPWVGPVAVNVATVFGGILSNMFLRPTWTWLKGWHILTVILIIAVGTAVVSVPDSTKDTPSVRSVATLIVSPVNGPRGATFKVAGSGYVPGEAVRVRLNQGPGLTTYDGPYDVGDMKASDVGAVAGQFVIPSEICCAGGTLQIVGTGVVSHRASPLVTFTLTP